MRAGLVMIGIAFVVVGLRLLDEARLPFASQTDKPFLAVGGVLFLAAAGGLLFRQRWAMFLGLPLLIVVAAFAIAQMLDQVSQGNQPGSFAVIGMPMFALLAALCALGFVALLRTALARR